MDGDHFQFNDWYIDNINVYENSLCPVAGAGPDNTICENDKWILAGATASNYSSLLWTTTGDGSFDNPTLLIPEYTPGVADIANGLVMLTLEAQPIAPCTISASDDMDLTIQLLPTVFAGNDATINCSGTYTMSGSASDYSSILWTTSGDGSFANNTSLTTNYNHGVNDINNRLVTLTLTSSPINPCVISVYDDMELTISGGQKLVIPQGWSGISTYVQPQPPDVAGMFAPIVNDLVILINRYDYYWPAYNINTIGNWVPYEGYVIKVSNDKTLQLCGTPVTSTSINLSQGWNLIPVLSSIDVDITALLGSIPCVVLVKGIPAGIYWPAYGVNTIGDLKPGKAYWVYVTCGCTLSYPPSPMKASTSPPIIVPTIQSPWNEVYRTSVSHVIGIADEFAGQFQGKIIGVFNSAGMCTGLAEMGKENNVLIVYGDDPTTTETDGMAEGGEMSFKVYDPFTKTERWISPDFDYSLPDRDGSFVINGISRISYTTSVSGYDAETGARIYPNPAKELITIALDGFVDDYSLTIRDLMGRAVLNQNINSSPRQTIYVGNLTKGVYQVVIRLPGKRITKKLVIQ